jgi:DNA-binding MarR family transcriptional regulator
MAAKGLFNKVKNRPTRRRFVVSTIRKGENLFETAVFEANFFYLPRRWNRPDLALETYTKDEAWDLHYRLTARLTQEFPARLLQEYRQNPPPASSQD